MLTFLRLFGIRPYALFHLCRDFRVPGETHAASPIALFQTLALYGVYGAAQAEGKKAGLGIEKESGPLEGNEPENRLDHYRRLSFIAIRNCPSENRPQVVRANDVERSG